MPYRYRVIEEGDNPDKGSFNGSCNRKACQAPKAVFYNEGTDFYYCRPCAEAINKANRDIGRDICTLDTDGSKAAY